MSVGVLLMWLIFWFGFTFGARIMGREKPAEYWIPGPVSSALRVLRAVKVLSWDEAGYARLLEEWTGVPVHQSAKTACLTIVGMTAPVLRSVMFGQKGSIKRGCAYACCALAGGGQPVFVDLPRRQLLGARSFSCVSQGVSPPCNKSACRDT